MSYNCFKNSCQWSGIREKRTVSITMVENLISRFNFKTAIVSPIAMVLGKRKTWPFPMPTPADYRGRARRRGGSGSVSESIHPLNPTTNRDFTLKEMTDCVRIPKHEVGG